MSSLGKGRHHKKCALEVIICEKRGLFGFRPFLFYSSRNSFPKSSRVNSSASNMTHTKKWEENKKGPSFSLCLMSRSDIGLTRKKSSHCCLWLEICISWWVQTWPRCDVHEGSFKCFCFFPRMGSQRASTQFPEPHNKARKWTRKDTSLSLPTQYPIPNVRKIVMCVIFLGTRYHFFGPMVTLTFKASSHSGKVFSQKAHILNRSV